MINYPEHLNSAAVLADKPGPPHLLRQVARETERAYAGRALR